MTHRLAILVLLALASAACSPDAPEPAPQASVPAPAPAPKVARVSTRCRGVEAGSALLDASQLDLARGVLKGPNLPSGWTPSGEAREPAGDDALWTALGAATAPHCATVQDYDTPGGRVTVLVAAFEDAVRASESASLVNAARAAGMAPAVLAGRTLTLIAPGDERVASAWSAAANVTPGARELDALLAAAQGTDRAVFDAALANALAANPGDAMPRAYEAGFLARLGDIEGAKSAALNAERKAANDPQALAETLHWQLSIARAERDEPATLASLADRQLAAATSSGNEVMRARALYDRATVRAMSGDEEGASSDLRAALELEKTLGGSSLRTAAATAPEFETLRKRPDW